MDYKKMKVKISRLKKESCQYKDTIQILLDKLASTQGTLAGAEEIISTLQNGIEKIANELEEDDDMRGIYDLRELLRKSKGE
jgi:hypothetical protein